jgi:hypothetical protein
MRIRAGAPSDRPFLDEMLFEAFFWKADVVWPPHSDPAASVARCSWTLVWRLDDRDPRSL